MELKINATSALWHSEVTKELLFRAFKIDYFSVYDSIYNIHTLPCLLLIFPLVVNINDQSNNQRCSKETIWNEMDLYSTENNINNGDSNENKNNSFNCDISNDNNDDNSTKTSNGQWNKACMCTGPDVNGSWIQCNSSTNLAFFNIVLTIVCFLTYLII